LANSKFNLIGLYSHSFAAQVPVGAVVKTQDITFVKVRERLTITDAAWLRIFNDSTGINAVLYNMIDEVTRKFDFKTLLPERNQLLTTEGIERITVEVSNDTLLNAYWDQEAKEKLSIEEYIKQLKEFGTF
jgi:hypothetical protein